MSMPPPSALSNSQESSATINSARSFPSNAYAPATIDEHTPPSSASQRQSGPSDALSGPISSHDTSRHVPQNDEYQVRARQDERQSTTSSSSSRLSGSPTHGSKRTASGAVKRRTPVGAYPQSPEADRRAIHSRNISTDTTSSSIGELSAQLKSRLSHAMRKVQSAQSPSQLTSPTSATSTTFSGDRTFHPPRPAISNTTDHPKTLSQVLQARNTPQTGHFYASHTCTHQSESYERGQPMRAPALAPGPNLNSQPCPHQPNGTSRPAQLQTSQPSAASKPTTLQVGRAQTPTQQEQDAVDTLLFMSSPHNSGRYPRDRDGVPASVSVSASPLRTEFGSGSGRNANARPVRALPNGAPAAALMQMASTSASMSMSSEEEYCAPDGARSRNGAGNGAGVSEEQRRAKRRSLGIGALRSEKEVDRVLDRMAGEEGSDSGELDVNGGMYERGGYSNVNGAGGRRR